MKVFYWMGHYPMHGNFIDEMFWLTNYRSVFTNCWLLQWVYPLDRHHLCNEYRYEDENERDLKRFYSSLSSPLMFAHRVWLLCICLVNNANKSICFVFSLFSSSPTKHLSFSSSLLIILSIHLSFYSFLLSPILLSDCLFPYPIYPFSCNGNDKLLVLNQPVFPLPLFSNPSFFLIISLSSTNLSFYHVPTPSPSSTHLFSLSSRWMIDHCLAEPWLNVHMDLHPDTHTYLVGKFCPSLLSPFVMAIIIILVSNYNYSVNGK